ncbi:lactate utilization protein C [Leeia sp.]|uniref:LutC/YkgG family protein n=1 Tax=Leeia sp. TaxID=2884678 RepID=UPI0035B4A4A5
MNSARERILARLQAQQPDRPASERITQRLQQPPLGPLPPGAQVEDLVTRFTEQALALSSTLEALPDLAAVPAAVARYLQQHALPSRAICWPQWQGLDWTGSGLWVEARPAHGDDLVGITGCFCAIAETGTLLLTSGSKTPAASSLLPETHIAIVPRQRLLPHMEAAWALLREEQGPLPRACNFVSGPSRTGDIEQTITLGAHGPYRVHILLVG